MVGRKSYADLVALAQFLPGPASDQVGIGVGMMRAGIWGGIVAWLGFTLPSVLMLMIFAYLMQTFDPGSAGWIQGLKIVAVAIVAQAVLGMAGKLASGPVRRYSFNSHGSRSAVAESHFSSDGHCSCRHIRTVVVQASSERRSDPR